MSANSMWFFNQTKNNGHPLGCCRSIIGRKVIKTSQIYVSSIDPEEFNLES